MKHKPLKYVILLNGIALSGVAAYYSVIGLASIFSGAFIPVVIMGAMLELAKIVTISWLYQNWNDALSIMKGYMITAIIVLMLITSMGIFGFLSRAHFEQNLPSSSIELQIKQLNTLIETEKGFVLRNEKTLKQLDTVLDTLTDAKRIRGSGGALEVRENQQPERNRLNIEITQSQQKILDLETKKLEQVKSITEIEAELGPIKYITQMLYGKENSSSHLDQSVRIVIMLLIFVFDPLAILMLLAANISFKKEKENFLGIEEYLNMNETPKQQTIKKKQQTNTPKTTVHKLFQDEEEKNKE